MRRNRAYPAARTGTIAIVLVVLLSAFAPAAAIPQPDGTVGMEQSADQETVAPGGSVTFEATINASGYNAPAMALDLPDGWTLVSQSADGPATFKGSTNEWVWLTSGEYTVTYTVDVPDDASPGDYAISNEGSAIDPSDDSFVSNEASTTVTVQDEAPENQPPTADAGADQTVEEGDSVALDASDSSDADGSIASYAWSQTGGPTVSLSDAAEAQPTFTAPEVEGDQTLTFAVEVIDDDGATDTNTVAVTVEDTDEPPATGGDISVSQTGPSGSVAPGDTVTVETTVDATDLNAPALQVSLPAGWTIQSESAEGPATFKDSTNEWIWAAGDVGEPYTVTYSVAVPDDAGDGQYTVTADASAIDPAQGDQTVSDTDQLTVAVADAPSGDGPSTSVALSPSSELLGVGQTGSFDVVVDAADGGVGAYELTVGVDDPNVATITDVSLSGATGVTLSDVQVADDGSTATVDAALLDTADTDAVTVATVDVESVAEGSTGVSIDVSTLATEDGTSYEVTATGDATLEVSSLVVGDSPNPAADPDGDGAYEDVNGDGTVDYTDIQVLYANRQGPTVTENPTAFDFNGDGGFDIADVQALYAQEAAE